MSAVLLLLCCLLAGCFRAKVGPRNTPVFAEPPPAPAQAPVEQPSPPLGEAPPFVYVRGEFRTEGRFPWTNGMTLKDAIETAGGFTQFAEHTVRLVRWDGSKYNYRLRSGWFATNNPVLKPGDIVFNPRRIL